MTEEKTLAEKMADALDLQILKKKSIGLQFALKQNHGELFSHAVKDYKPYFILSSKLDAYDYVVWTLPNVCCWTHFADLPTIEYILLHIFSRFGIKEIDIANPFFGKSVEEAMIMCDLHGC